MDFRITMTGVTGLIMNNARLANPLNPTVKAIKTLTGKASKDRTDEDREEIMRLEHAGALYHDADIGPYLPGDNIWRSLQEGAVKHRLGPKFEQGVLIVTDTNPVSYRGPRDVDDLWADENFRFYASRVTGSSGGVSATRSAVRSSASGRPKRAAPWTRLSSTSTSW